MAAPRKFICGCKETVLTETERTFFSQSDPWGYILFKRNIIAPEQLRRLVDDLREAVGRDAPILIDQEGGRVGRLGQPHWHNYPSARRFGRLAERNFLTGAQALELNVRLIAQDVAATGMDAICLPVLDVPWPKSHSVIGDRAYSEDASMVSRLGRIAALTLLEEGVLPIAKHVPGHGRATLDSHRALPTVSASQKDLISRDFLPFRALADIPVMMTAHILYTAFDEYEPATFSSAVIKNVIRGHIGFEGLLLSDDLAMGALSGAMEKRGRLALDAGCDILLHCNGDLREMEVLAQITPFLSGKSEHRANIALVSRHARARTVPSNTRRQLRKLLKGESRP